MPAAQTVAEDTILPIAGVSVADIDSSALTTTLSVSSGILDVTAGAGVTDNGTASVTITARQRRSTRRWRASPMPATQLQRRRHAHGRDQRRDRHRHRHDRDHCQSSERRRATAKRLQRRRRRRACPPGRGGRPGLCLEDEWPTGSSGGTVAHAPVTSDWHVVGVGDFNGDSTATFSGVKTAAARSMSGR